MNGKGRRLGLLSGLAVGALLLGAGCGSDDETQTETINLVAANSGVVQVEGGTQGPSQGDVNVFDTPVTFADSGEPAGRFYGMQMTVSLDDEKEVVQGSFTFDLAEGTISVGGISEYPKGVNALTREQEFERPIVGGTGKYSNASGTDTTVLNADGEYEHELRLEN